MSGKSIKPLIGQSDNTGDWNQHFLVSVQRRKPSSCIIHLSSLRNLPDGFAERRVLMKVTLETSFHTDNKHAMSEQPDEKMSLQHTHTHTQQHTTQFCCKYINKKLICCSGWQEWCNTCTDECKRSSNLETLKKKKENKASVLTLETAVGNIHLSQGQLLSTTCCHAAQLWAAPQFLLCIASWSAVFIASRLK